MRRGIVVIMLVFAARTILGQQAIDQAQEMRLIKGVSGGLTTFVPTHRLVTVGWRSRWEPDMDRYSVHIAIVADTSAKYIWAFLDSVPHVWGRDTLSCDMSIPVGMWVRAGVSAIDAYGNDSDMSVSEWLLVTAGGGHVDPDDKTPPGMPMIIYIRPKE